MEGDQIPPATRPTETPKERKLIQEAMTDAHKLSK
jgi:hypothetical protein